MMQIPRIKKVVINVGLGEAIQNPRAMEMASKDIALITGQQPVPTKARRSVATFKIRQGLSIGLMATLQGDRAWVFLD